MVSCLLVPGTFKARSAVLVPSEAPLRSRVLAQSVDRATPVELQSRYSGYSCNLEVYTEGECDLVTPEGCGSDKALVTTRKSRLSANIDIRASCLDAILNSSSLWASHIEVAMGDLKVTISTHVWHRTLSDSMGNFRI